MAKGPQITIVSIGKTKERWLEVALEEYTKRTAPWCHMVWKTASTDSQLVHSAASSRECIGLDPQGTLMTSEEFAIHLHEKLVAGGSRLTFLIGGPEGLPSQIRETYPLLSLSPMTFTHQMTRLILGEQIYRSAMQWTGKPYHK